MKVYFDNAASTQVRSEAIEVMTEVMREDYGNPSSVHAFGRDAKSWLGKARGHVATALVTKPDNIYFTSGGTEANNWAIFGVADKYSRNGKHIITSEIEHSAVLDPIKKLEKSGFEVTYLAPDTSGVVPVQEFKKALREDTVFASVMLVNNETGVINPVGDYVSEIKQKKLKTIFHTDAVQAFCKIPFSVKSLGADLITVSSHKLHGPKGAGALYIKDDIKLTPLILGGSHEKSNRGGTEATPALCGFGEAVKHGFNEQSEIYSHVENLKEYIIENLKEELPAIVIINETSSSPFILSVSLPGYKSEVLMNYLDGKDIAVSRSAACKKGARSRTLEAMRLDDKIIDGALRVSFSKYSTLKEADYFIKNLKEASENVIRFSW